LQADVVPKETQQPGRKENTLKERQRRGGKNQKKKKKTTHPSSASQNWDSLPNMRILSHKEETDVHGWNLHVALFSFSSRIQ